MGLVETWLHGLQMGGVSYIILLPHGKCTHVDPNVAVDV